MKTASAAQSVLESEGEDGGSGLTRALSSPDIVSREIMRGLYSGRYARGQRLIEADMMRDFKVSRGSVREALRRLAAEGVVSLTLHRGAYIRWLTRPEVQDVLGVFEVLTGLAASSAARRVREGADGSSVQRAADEMSVINGEDYFEIVRAQNRFYRTIVSLGGNKELARVLPSMNVHFVYLPFGAYKIRMESYRLAEYQNVAEAILAGNPAKAEKVARAYVRHLSLDLDQLPPEAFAEEA